MSVGPWEVSRVVQPPGLCNESRLSQMKREVPTEIRGGLDRISGFITSCPKFLLAEGELLTYLLHSEELLNCYTLNSSGQKRREQGAEKELTI